MACVTAVPSPLPLGGTGPGAGGDPQGRRRRRGAGGPPGGPPSTGSPLPTLTVLPRLLEMLEEVAAENPLLGTALAPRLLPGLERQRHGGGGDPPGGSDPAHGGAQPQEEPERGAGRPKPQRGRGQAAAGGSGPGEEVPRPRGPDAASRARGAPLAGAGRRRPPSRPLPAPRRVKTAGQGAGRAFPRSPERARAPSLARGRASLRSPLHGGAWLCTLVRPRTQVCALGHPYLGLVHAHTRSCTLTRACSHMLVHAQACLCTCAHLLTFGHVHLCMLTHISRVLVYACACSHTLMQFCTLAHTLAFIHTHVDAWARARTKAAQLGAQTAPACGPRGSCTLMHKHRHAQVLHADPAESRGRQRSVPGSRAGFIYKTSSADTKGRRGPPSCTGMYTLGLYVQRDPRPSGPMGTPAASPGLGGAPRQGLGVRGGTGEPRFGGLGWEGEGGDVSVPWGEGDSRDRGGDTSVPSATGEPHPERGPPGVPQCCARKGADPESEGMFWGGGLSPAGTPAHPSVRGVPRPHVPTPVGARRLRRPWVLGAAVTSFLACHCCPRAGRGACPQPRASSKGFRGRSPLLGRGACPGRGASSKGGVWGLSPEPASGRAAAEQGEPRRGRGSLARPPPRPATRPGPCRRRRHRAHTRCPRPLM